MASPEDANRLVTEATTLAKQGQMVEAAGKFLAAFKADPRPELLCNVAIAYQKAGNELARAELFFSQCLTRAQALDPKFVDSLRATLVSVEQQLRTGPFTPIDIVVEPSNATVSVAEFSPEEAFIGSRLIWLPFGAHVVVVSLEGYVQQRVTVETRSNIQRSVRVELERAPAFDLPPPPPFRPVPKSRRPAFVATVTAGALGVIGGAAYLRARNRATAAGEITLTGAREDYDALVRSARRWQHVAWGSGVAAALAAGTASVLWMRLRRGSVSIVPTGTTAVARFALAF